MSKQAKIQDAVAAIILQEGPAGVSTTKVAQRVGIAQSNVYLYFKNKQALIDSVYQRETQQISDYTKLTKLSSTNQSVSARVQTYIRQVYDYSLSHPDSLTILQQIKSLRGQGMELTVGADDPNNVVVQLLQAAIDAGVIKPVPVSLHMSLVFSIIHTHTVNLQRGTYPADQYSFDDIYQFIWDAMKK